LNIGSIQLPIKLNLDSSLSGVLQGMLVLSVLLMDGVRRKLVVKL
jgi:simple sugar transport system permease protein